MTAELPAIDWSNLKVSKKNAWGTSRRTFVVPNATESTCSLEGLDRNGMVSISRKLSHIWQQSPARKKNLRVVFSLNTQQSQGGEHRVGVPGNYLLRP
jgi:hypothetical protein